MTTLKETVYIIKKYFLINAIFLYYNYKFHLMLTICERFCISNHYSYEKLFFFRKKVDDRKLEYDRIERAIYPAVHLTSEDNCDAYKAQETYDEKVSVPLAIKLRKAIVNLQNAAEVTEKKDVLNQFFKQRSLKQKLQNIRSETEGEKISLENKRQVLSTEVEIKKFADAEDTNQ